MMGVRSPKRFGLSKDNGEGRPRKRPLSSPQQRGRTGQSMRPPLGGGVLGGNINRARSSTAGLIARDEGMGGVAEENSLGAVTKLYAKLAVGGRESTRSGKRGVYGRPDSAPGRVVSRAMTRGEANRGSRGVGHGGSSLVRVGSSREGGEDIDGRPESLIEEAQQTQKMLRRMDRWHQITETSIRDKEGMLSVLRGSMTRHQKASGTSWERTGLRDLHGRPVDSLVHVGLSQEWRV